MSDELYLRHILECIERIESYVTGGKTEFLESTLIQDAVIRNFEIIGEAVKRLETASTEKHPEVAWKNLAGFRDVLIHQYANVDLEIVWQTVEVILAPLKAAITNLLPQTNSE